MCASPALSDSVRVVTSDNFGPSEQRRSPETGVPEAGDLFSTDGHATTLVPAEGQSGRWVQLSLESYPPFPTALKPRRPPSKRAARAMMESVDCWPLANIAHSI